MASRREQLVEIMQDAAKGETKAVLRSQIADLQRQLSEAVEHAEKAERERDEVLVEAFDAATAHGKTKLRATSTEAEMARLREALRGNWHGVFLDGRNEHGSHVLMLPQRSIDLEQDEAGNFLKGYAETILTEAATLGFEVGDAVVVAFELCLDEGFFSHYEFVGVSADLTAALYGTAREQSAARAALQGEPTAPLNEQALVEALDALQGEPKP